MSKKKKIIFITALFAILYMSYACGLCVFGITEEEYEELINSQLTQVGAQELESLPDESTQSLLEKLGITGINAEQMMRFDLKGYASVAGAVAAPAVKQPAACAAMVCGLLLIAGILNGTEPSGAAEGFSQAKKYFCAIALCTALLGPIMGVVNDAARVSEAISGIIAVFVPVFTTAVAGSGQPVSASLTAAGLFTVSELSVWLIIKTVIPLSAVFMALGIVNSINAGVDFSGSVSIFKKAALWILGTVTAIFTAVLSLKTYLAANADALAVKTAKIVVSSVVPVVGGGLSDAVSAIYSSLGVVKASVGYFGIVLLFLTVLPFIVRLALWRLAVAVCSGFAKCLNLQQPVKLFGAVGDMLTVLIAVFSFITAAMIIIIAVVIKTGTAVA